MEEEQIEDNSENTESDQNSDMVKSVWGSLWPILLTFFLTSFIVGGGVYWWQGSKNVPIQENSKVVETQTITEVVETQTIPDLEKQTVKEQGLTVVPTKLVDAVISGTPIKQDYNFRNGESEKFTSINLGSVIFMQKKAMATIYKNEESITSVYTPENPTNSDIVFISTSGATVGEWPEIKSTNKIYSYNLKTGELVKLYEELENRILRTMGMDGSKLVLMYDKIDNSPGPCFSIWKDWESFGYLELADIAGGLKTYTVPAYQVEIDKIEQDKCIAEMSF
ncbi:MAG: hypothetical protein CO137_03650 [Candidatus Magasanikbacteria bacterium CG_4_9_14_3_um_filter_32_9]|uniref:Uncharacterized protein n=1 Tax=Candidatus Magasanikbacteria bacterium CG_4_9_14_3_um_filter_32_9 TaxID=1974644 RepID=A0A2M7Z620_9BACT|nr:MAG: hypothetical protein CO137_03650 [Candidatus Magasanikbacteria bacterium CG_4_9_14_3_um_filter_32_9]